MMRLSSFLVSGIELFLSMVAPSGPVLGAPSNRGRVPTPEGVWGRVRTPPLEALEGRWKGGWKGVGTSIVAFRLGLVDEPLSRFRGRTNSIDADAPVA
jgi:hypothetical protein